MIGVVITPKHCILRVTNRHRRKTSNIYIYIFHFFNIVLVLLFSKQKSGSRETGGLTGKLTDEKQGTGGYKPALEPRPFLGWAVE